MRIFVLGLLINSLFWVACDDQTPDEEEPYITIARTDDGQLEAELLAEDSLKVGLNTIYYRITDLETNDPVYDAEVEQTPVMYMMDYAHSCPHTNPDRLANADDLFVGEIVFIMAGGAMGHWDDTLKVTPTGTGSTHTLVFHDISVRETNMKKNLVYVDADSNQVIYILTLNGLDETEVGTNPFILTIARKESLMSFTPVTDLDITVEPRMPDMGHGSEGNVDPVHTEHGKYAGTVGFNMTGYWTVDFTCIREGDTLGVVQYEFNF